MKIEANCLHPITSRNCERGVQSSRVRFYWLKAAFRVDTLLRATLKNVKTRNITLSIPEDLLRQIKIVAAGRDSSVSAMLTSALRQIADDEDGYAEASRRMLTDLRKGYRLGTNGKSVWTRDDMHGR